MPGEAPLRALRLLDCACAIVCHATPPCARPLPKAARTVPRTYVGDCPAYPTQDVASVLSWAIGDVSRRIA
jgi:hypothetical protein